MNPIYLILIFLVSSFVGYLIIKNVPSLLHTPLMSGMNALAGICLLGAIVTVGYSYQAGGTGLLAGQIFGGIGVLLATVNVVAGFGVTHRMLRMFNPKKKSTEK
ncbi:NAD(P) transhydrogenase subunit alpha [Dysgonomonas sp. PFB1-18]|uniref:NAD(P) transhydrogenase subunit alpha n=1 Tax=unclassified Dysgonomonas TaxID=2630389 RepID=UPI002476E761|nr:MULTISPECIES: NAD(P) transhydrogenase subunit alpha [unclassified Dysgonomonas]MDH6308740.1 NAD(P) transhydrogenase subunit alpha [Dysgonomonas sp. PF1-14]MDH6338563.1 NAD(P) transhydrogenase subunit alpha [Dysgonomonas sp. PF1-16]MDH6379989.1 NAD(P) transhydrogenase subunit alpha [Dysgonomonas sp. PFB1-18]MDH6397391.1 NAD(P) transhydrogenase subunit alpha [Dysgonomonas sp. PF1-23]